MKIRIEDMAKLDDRHKFAFYRASTYITRNGMKATFMPGADPECMLKWGAYWYLFWFELMEDGDMTKAPNSVPEAEMEAARKFTDDFISAHT